MTVRGYLLAVVVLYLRLRWFIVQLLTVTVGVGVLLSASVFLYGSFYYWYMPSVVHERPVHFKFRLASRNNQCCYQGLGCQGQGLKISKAKAKVFKAKYLQKAKAKAMISERKTVYRPWRLAPSWARWGQINNSWATQSRTMPRQACQVLEAKAMAPVLKDPGGQGVVLEDTSLEITTTTNHLVCKNSRHYIA